MSKPTRDEAIGAVRTIIEYLGEDPDREGLAGTPDRVVRSWDRLYGGYQIDPSEVMRTDFSADGYGQMVLLRGVEFWSSCEHHMLPFYGCVSVGYLPGDSGRILGISKLARAVEVFARRLQIQERMTQQIADAVQDAVGARGVGVIVRAKHLCMVARGVEKQQSEMVTSALLGAFREFPAVRDEFLRLTGERA